MSRSCGRAGKRSNVISVTVPYWSTAAAHHAPPFNTTDVTDVTRQTSVCSNSSSVKSGWERRPLNPTEFYTSEPAQLHKKRPSSFLATDVAGMTDDLEAPPLPPPHVSDVHFHVLTSCHGVNRSSFQLMNAYITISWLFLAGTREERGKKKKQVYTESALTL